MPTDVTVYHDFEAEATERLKRLRRYFPPYLHDSEVIQMFVAVWGEEISSRLVDQFLAIIRNIRPTTADDTGISLWEELLDLEHNIGDSNDLIIARILAKTVKESKITLISIANVVRFYLSGTRTFSSAAIVDSATVPVKDITGFTLGQVIYIGSLRRSIIQIDAANSAFVVDQKVSLPAYSIISEHQVFIDEGGVLGSLLDYSDTVAEYNEATQDYGGADAGTYAFDIFVDIGLIFDQASLINAILAARPAHLGFRILSGDIDYDDAAIDYNESTPDAQYNSWNQIFTT